MFLKDSLLTGDWETPAVEHHCPGAHCCLDREASQEKVIRCVTKLARSLQPTILERGNWQGWPGQLRLFSFLGGLHQCLQSVLQDTFGVGAVQPPDDGGEDVGDLRGEAAELGVGEAGESAQLQDCPELCILRLVPFALRFWCLPPTTEPVDEHDPLPRLSGG